MVSQLKWVVLITLFLYVNSCHKIDNNTSSDFIVNDPPAQPSEKKAQSIPFLFQSDTNKLYARILLANNDKPKPTIIFLHGNPGFEKNEDIGQALRRNCINAVFFSYTGTWGNPGYFSYSQSIKDNHNLIDYLHENARHLRIDTSNIYLCGFSMGADIALLSVKNNSVKPRGIILIDPWHGYDWLKSKDENGILQYAKALEKRPAIKIESGQQFINEILSDNKYNLHAAINTLNIPSICLFSSEDQKNEFTSSIDVHSLNHHTLDASDHSFSNKRVALTKKIYNWISENVIE